MAKNGHFGSFLGGFILKLWPKIQPSRIWIFLAVFKLQLGPAQQLVGVPPPQCPKVKHSHSWGGGEGGRAPKIRAVSIPWEKVAFALAGWLLAGLNFEKGFLGFFDPSTLPLDAIGSHGAGFDLTPPPLWTNRVAGKAA
eukprot:EG_transcript_18323